MIALSLFHRLLLILFHLFQFHIYHMCSLCYTLLLFYPFLFSPSIVKNQCNSYFELISLRSKYLLNYHLQFIFSFLIIISTIRFIFGYTARCRQRCGLAFFSKHIPNNCQRLHFFLVSNPQISIYIEKCESATTIFILVCFLITRIFYLC